MLTEEQVGQFLAFGYVVLKECLSPDEVRTLQEAFDRAIEGAPKFDVFGAAGTRRVIDFVEADDSFGALIEHPNIMEAMRDIDGTEFLYDGSSDLTANVDDVFWHCDGIPSRQLRTATERSGSYPGATTQSSAAPFCVHTGRLRMSTAGPCTIIPLVTIFPVPFQYTPNPATCCCGTTDYGTRR